MRVSIDGVLFGRHGEGLLAVADHAAHVANAFRALGFAPVAHEDIARPGGAGLDGAGDVTLTKAIAVADVQETTKDS